MDAVAEPTGETPLMTAAACGNTAVLDLLLRAGADPEKQRWAGRAACREWWSTRQWDARHGQLLQKEDIVWAVDITDKQLW